MKYVLLSIYLFISSVLVAQNKHSLMPLSQLNKVFHQSQVSCSFPSITTSEINWNQVNTSFQANGIKTFIAMRNNSIVGTLSFDSHLNVEGALWLDKSYTLKVENTQLIAIENTQTKHACVLNSLQKNSTRFAVPMVSANNPSGVTGKELSDGVFRDYRLAIFFSKDDYESKRFDKDINKINTWLATVEAFLNTMYVRDAGIHFTLVRDERLIKTNVKASNIKIDKATELINNAIGVDNYDVGVALYYVGDDAAGGASYGYVGAVSNPQYKGGVVIVDQEPWSLGHELGHYFGSQHTFGKDGPGGIGYGSEPGAGQSILSYGRAADFISVKSLQVMRPHIIAGDARMNKIRPNYSFKAENTAPVIDREKMKTEYIVPKETFFSIPIYASDAEQKVLHYAFQQDNYDPMHPAHFATLHPTTMPVLNFGRRYNPNNFVVINNTDKIPVGEYRFTFTVSDALPYNEAVEKKQAPLYDAFQTTIKVIDVEKPFKITSAIKTEYKAGETFRLTWNVDKHFFNESSRVRVLLSDDGGETFKYTLVPDAPNNGECEVVMPQAAINKVEVYGIDVAGEHIPIYFMGKAVLKLETFDGYYDVSDNGKRGEEMVINSSSITFNHLPENSVVELKEGEEMPVKPEVTATDSKGSLDVTFKESVEGDWVKRTWTASNATDKNSFVQYIHKVKTASGISMVKKEVGDKAKKYDLDGREITQPIKNNIYIIDGKKYLEK